MGSQGERTDDGGRHMALVDWFAAQCRDLPWRSTRDPWFILVSETMLQQTQVSRVLDRLPGFLDRFPTPTAMADSEASGVITEWVGLGYNRRGLNLHRAAVGIRDNHAGEVPTDLKALLKLPGVGAYTARAVRVFAFEEHEAVVDTNIGRVLSRWENRALRPSEAQSLADRLVPAGRSWLWNQAIMELGALVCSKSPQCEQCPVSEHCAWFASGRKGADPAIGSAAVSKRQPRFEGSDRQGRAALVRALTTAPVRTASLAAAMGWPEDPDRAERVAGTLVRDGLATLNAGVYRLPD